MVFVLVNLSRGFYVLKVQVDEGSVYQQVCTVLRYKYMRTSAISVRTSVTSSDEVACQG